MAITLHPIPILEDNYVWTLIDQDTKHAVIVDPGEAAPVIDYLNKEGLTLTGILITHHHWDHTDGIQSLIDEYPVPVVGPKHDNILLLTKPVVNDDLITLPGFPLTFKVIEIGGHTTGHIAYYTDGLLFCG